MVLLFGFIGAVFQLSTPVRANDHCTMWPDKDAHVVDGEYANSNYGYEEIFGSGVSGAYTARAFLHFNLDSCMIPSQCTIELATLYLFDCVHADSGVFCIDAADGGWSEYGINWNNRKNSPVCSAMSG
jgi:hypothetical protein